MKDAQIEIRHYNRNGKGIDVSSENFRTNVQKITEEVIKSLLDMT